MGTILVACPSPQSMGQTNMCFFPDIFRYKGMESFRTISLNALQAWGGGASLISSFAKLHEQLVSIFSSFVFLIQKGKEKR